MLAYAWEIRFLLPWNPIQNSKGKNLDSIWPLLELQQVPWKRKKGYDLLCYREYNEPSLSPDFLFSFSSYGCRPIYWHKHIKYRLPRTSKAFFHTGWSVALTEVLGTIGPKVTAGKILMRPTMSAPRHHKIKRQLFSGMVLELFATDSALLLATEPLTQLLLNLSNDKGF